jgi:hypothetical protein
MGIGFRHVGLAALVGLCWVGPVNPVMGQSSSASASEAKAPLGKPSTLSIKTNLLKMKKAELERQIRDAQRCIEQATPGLRGPAGTVNRVASTDLINCTRKLAVIKAKLESLGNEAESLSLDAEALAMRLETVKSKLEVNRRINLGSGQ